MKKTVLIISSSILISFSLSFILANPPESNKSNIHAPSSINHDLPITSTLARGVYLIELTLGTPPQTVHSILSTSSKHVWSPCGFNFHFSESFFQEHPPKISKFNPESSKSWRYLKCDDPRCYWMNPERRVYQSSHCDQGCSPDESQTCSKPCRYDFSFVMGSTHGTILVDQIYVGDKIMHDFLFGCSNFSVGLSVGVAGFGRGPLSLPSQLGIKKFSYCLTDTTPGHYQSRISQNVAFDKTSNNGNPSYTKFYIPPLTLSPSLQKLYFVILEEIIVGNVFINIPRRLVLPTSDGKGGTVLDSSNNFITTNGRIYQLLVREFLRQLGRNNYIGGRELLDHCFRISDTARLPKLILRFKDGVDMELPVDNYFVRIGSGNVFCLTLTEGRYDFHAPAVILGSFSQQEFYMEYDLENERLGFRQQKCAEEMVLKIQN